MSTLFVNRRAGSQTMRKPVPSCMRHVHANGPHQAARQAALL